MAVFPPNAQDDESPIALLTHQLRAMHALLLSCHCMQQLQRAVKATQQRYQVYSRWGAQTARAKSLQLLAKCGANPLHQFAFSVRGHWAQM